MHPDSLLRLWRYINHLLTYLLTYQIAQTVSQFHVLPCCYTDQTGLEIFFLEAHFCRDFLFFSFTILHTKKQRNTSIRACTASRGSETNGRDIGAQKLLRIWSTNLMSPALHTSRAAAGKSQPIGSIATGARFSHWSRALQWAELTPLSWWIKRSCVHSLTTFGDNCQ